MGTPCNRISCHGRRPRETRAVPRPAACRTTQSQGDTARHSPVDLLLPGTPGARLVPQRRGRDPAGCWVRHLPDNRVPISGEVSRCWPRRPGICTRPCAGSATMTGAPDTGGADTGASATGCPSRVTPHRRTPSVRRLGGVPRLHEQGRRHTRDARSTWCATTRPPTHHPRRARMAQGNTHLHFHVTPTRSRWINQIESWLEITKS